MKKLIALLAVLSMLLCGCGEESKTTDTTEHNDRNISTEAPEELPTQNVAPMSPVSAEDYYRYLNDVFLQDYQLAAEAPISTTQGQNTRDLWKNGGTGLVSAMVEDFNGDGVLEMLTVELNELSVMDTFWNGVCYEAGAPYDPDNRCLRFLVRHFIYDNDQITEYGAGTMNIFPDAHWGNMILGIEKIEDEYYLFSKMTSENMGTYGPSMYTVYRLGGNGMNPMYTAPLEYGLADRTNYLELMGLENTINPKELSLDDLVIPNYEKSPKEIREALGNRLLCVFNVECLGEDFVHQLVDYTNLRRNLKDNGGNWQRIDLPEGYRKELPAVPEEVSRIASDVESAANCRFAAPIAEQEDGIYMVSYSTGAGNELSLRWDGGANVLTSVSVRGVSGSPDEEWYAIKDALLGKVLTLSPEDQSLFIGKNANWNDYVNGIQLGSYTIRMFAVQDAVFSASLTQ